MYKNLINLRRLYCLKKVKRFIIYKNLTKVNHFGKNWVLKMLKNFNEAKDSPISIYKNLRNFEKFQALKGLINYININN